MGRVRLGRVGQRRAHLIRGRAAVPPQACEARRRHSQGASWTQPVVLLRPGGWLVGQVANFIVCLGEWARGVYHMEAANTTRKDTQCTIARPDSQSFAERPCTNEPVQCNEFTIKRGCST